MGLGARLVTGAPGPEITSQVKGRAIAACSPNSVSMRTQTHQYRGGIRLGPLITMLQVFIDASAIFPSAPRAPLLKDAVERFSTREKKVRPDSRMVGD